MFTSSVYKRFDDDSDPGVRPFQGSGNRLSFRSLSPISSSSVHHGARLNYDDLQETAHRLLKESDYTQQAMADRLDVSRISVARAVTEPGPKFQRLQMRVIEALSNFEVERREKVEFRTWETASGGSDEENEEGHLLGND